MQDSLGENLKKLKWTRKRKSCLSVILTLLSLVVVFDVFWVLKKPGLTRAGDAACGIPEHTHSDACNMQLFICDLSEDEHTHEDTCCTWKTVCGYEEHVHSIACYSDETADVETPLDWQRMFDDYPFTGDLRQDLVGIAQTQAGYSESTMNFEVDREGTRHGYTRYGAWYGAPYSEWSAMFVSFCLNYAGADPNENPGNTGADSMAAAWNTRNKFAPAGEYLPSAGDLVFFDDNTAGIVTMVHNATFYAICGDINNTVSGTLLPLDDPSVSGWGLTEGTVYSASAASVSDIMYVSEQIDAVSDQQELEFQAEILGSEGVPSLIPEIIEAEITAVSDVPEFLIYADSKTEEPVLTFSSMSSETVTDLVEYLNANNGSFSFTLLDENNQPPSKDENGRFTVTPGTSYKLTLTISGRDGFVPGTYLYQLPKGLQVSAVFKEFILENGTNVGSWEATADGQILMVFNENINTHSQITISSTIEVQFPEQDDPIDFDGNITVTVEKPPTQLDSTKLSKWGKQGNEEDLTPDPTKLYWTVQIAGGKDSEIQGSVLSDKVLYGTYSKEHRYTESDIAGGLDFGVSEPDPETGAEKAWHSWHVSADDPNLTWTETEWSYEIPETVICNWCGELALGNDDWIYTVRYSSTPDPSDIAGTFGYENEAEVDGQTAYGWIEFTHGTTQADIIKNGSFHGDADGGAFIWEFQVTIPGMTEDRKADYYWYIMDDMSILDSSNSIIGRPLNDADSASVTATVNGTTFTVPNVSDASYNDPFAWINNWSWPDGDDAVKHGREIDLLCRCSCTEENCPLWNYWGNNSCGSLHWSQKGFCQCWTAAENTTFTFSYKTEDLSIIEKYGGLGNKLHNEAVLYNKPDYNSYVEADRSADSVPIPGVFKKELTQDFDGYKANYVITVNEAKLALTDSTPVTIRDEMTQTLAYISGSLVVTAEDAAGNTYTLRQDNDYTVNYDGTGNQTDENGDPVHVMEIVILNPQPVMYVLDYDAMLIIPDGTAQAVGYSNAASITLWGTKISDEVEDKFHADINISTQSYLVDLHKTDSLTNASLAGASFGLFNEQNRLITDDETDANGELSFRTNITQGIILRDHELYYVQELNAPAGYRLDDTKYWFCFCDSSEYSCTTCDEILQGTDALRIPYDSIEVIEAENDRLNYDLPATGGSGIYPIMMAGVVFIFTPLAYGILRKRK